MSFFTNLRAERLIADIKAAGGTDDDAARRSFEKLGKLGPSAIPRIIDALANADKTETAGFVGVLVGLLDKKTLPAVVAGLSEGNQRTVAALTWALSSAGRRQAGGPGVRGSRAAPARAGERGRLRH